MNDQPILDFLRAQFDRVHKRFDDIALTLAEHGTRLTRLETAVLNLRRDQVGDAEYVSHQAVRLDGVMARIERIERRLDLVEPQ